nr:hypothetical protein [Rosenbergiella epipactidis]
MAKEQKYKTYWFDAQMQNNMWNKSFGFISKYADVRLVPDGNNTEFPINEGADLKLLSYVKEYFSKPAEKNFYVIHLMGNHLPYSYNGGQDVSFFK